jgi:hypothetical protein
MFSYNSGTGTTAISLPYGIWIVYGCAGFQVTVPVSSTGTISSVQVGINGNTTTINGNYSIRDDSTNSIPYSATGTYISHQVMQIWVVNSGTNANLYLNAKYTFTGCTLNSRIGYSSLNAFRIA